jgi:ankyrin repeat protein
MSLEQAPAYTYASYDFSLFDFLQVDPEQPLPVKKDESKEEEDLEPKSPGHTAHVSTSKRNFSGLLLNDDIEPDDRDADFFDDEAVPMQAAIGIKTEADEPVEKYKEEKAEVKAETTEEEEQKEDVNKAPEDTKKEDDDDEAIPMQAAIGIKTEADEPFEKYKEETKEEGTEEEEQKEDVNKAPEDTKKEDDDDEAIPVQAIIGINTKADEPVEEKAEVKAEEGTKAKENKENVNKAPEEKKDHTEKDAKKSKKGDSVEEEGPDWLIKDDNNEARVFAKQYTKDMQRDHTFSVSLSDTFLGNLKKTIHRDSANELFKLLNRDPLSESNRYSDDAVTAFLLKHPEACTVKYAFEAFNEPIYPLSMLCTLRPSEYAVQLCFEAHEDAIDSNDTWVGTPLHFACAFGASNEVVDYLILNENACVRLINHYRQIPLHVACGAQCTKQVAALLIADDPMTLEIADKDCMMPLHLACDNGAELGLVQELIPEYPLACIAQTNNGATPLHIAVARRASLPVLKVLVKGHDAALKVVDDRGRTPLHIAVLVQADYKTIKLLAKKKAFKMKNHMGQTPFEVAETMADATFADGVMKLLKSGKGE